MEPTSYFRSYATLASAVIMSTADPKPNRRSTCCGIYCGGAGTLVIRPMGETTDANDQTITAIAGGPIMPVECDRIVSGTATLVTVFWPRM